MTSYRMLTLSMAVALGLGATTDARAAVDAAIYDGEPGSAPLLSTTCPEYAAEVAGGGYAGTKGLQMKPDPWHQSALNLYCGGAGRRDLSGFDVIDVRIKAAQADGGSPKFWVRTYNQVSNAVDIATYVEGGKVDATWRTARIPVSALATDAWKLGNVERLVIGPDSQYRSWIIDDVVARDVMGPSLESAGAVSESVVRLRVSERFDLDGARYQATYVVKSTTDAAFSAGVTPSQVGVHVRFRDFGPSDEAVSDHMIHLVLPKPLANGHTYTVTASGVRDTVGNPSAPTTLTFTWDDVVGVSAGIKVNQIGYLPDRPKYGYVGAYLGYTGGAVWAVGDGGTIARWATGLGWKAVASPTSAHLHDVAATTESLGFAVGDQGTILQWNGSQWAKVASPTTAALHSVTFGPTRTAWAVGASGTALRWQGGAWQTTSTPTTATLRGVWAGPDGAAWAVGDAGTILQWTGSAWTKVTSPTTADLLDIDGATENMLWAVGTGSTILLHQWGSFKAYTGKPAGTQTLRGVAVDIGGGAYVTGDGGVLWHRAKFGSDPFTALSSGTSASMRGIARLDERTLLAVGTNGASIVGSQTGFSGATAAPLTLNSVSALPYGAMRLYEPLPDATLFDASTGETVWSAPLELRHANWPLSGEDVYLFDFSAFSTPGTYRAYVPGVGVSEPFAIGADVMSQVATTTGRSLYYQRCGEALLAPHVEPGYERGLCHSPVHDAAFHSSLPGTPLYGGEPVGGFKDAAGGWHDAGDFGKYMPTLTAAVWYLLEGYDLDPSRFGDGAWNIPESGNGVPDMLDEARVAIDWIRKIGRADGGYTHKVTAACWYNGMPETEKVTRYVFETTTFDTGTAAAVLASAARVYAPYDPATATAYLQAAEQAWTFLANHPNPTPTGGFKNPAGNCTGEYNETDDIDNRMWAAAELYRTTGNAKYRTAFEGWWANNGSQWGWNDWQHHYKRAYWAYLRTTHPTTASIKDSIRASMVKQADDIASFTLQNPYMNGSRLDVPEWIGWGAFSLGAKTAFPLLQAFALTGNEAYRDLAVVNADAQLGSNPLSISFITGLGARSPQNPLDMESEYDGVDAPVPGFPLFGVHHNQSKANKYQAATQDDANNYPATWTTLDPLPVLLRFNDAFELPMMTEFTVLEQALTTVTFHLLADSAPTAPVEQACGGASACDDGDPCTTDTCDPAKGCVSASNTAPCDDGDACTIKDICGASGCSGQALVCNDDNPCTTDSCDAKVGCTYTPNTAACNDGDACTTGDVCSAGVCGGMAVTCDDSDPCTFGTCSPTGGCSYTIDLSCAMPDPDCTSAADCDDGNPCTTDSCDATGSCISRIRRGSCDDGDACTVKDYCSQGVCGGRALKCRAGKTCDPTVGVCK